MMTLYEIFNGQKDDYYTGFFCWRVYVWTDSQQRAVELAAKRFKENTERIADYFDEGSTYLSSELKRLAPYYHQNSSQFYDPSRFYITRLFSADSPEFVSEISDESFDMPMEVNDDTTSEQ